MHIVQIAAKFKKKKTKNFYVMTSIYPVATRKNKHAKNK